MKRFNTVRFLRWDCRVELRRYRNGHRSIHLVDKETDEPIACATLNIPWYPLDEDAVIIKDYSENQGMMDALREAGIIEPMGIQVSAGYAEAEVCRLCL